jgi:exopolysaccharide production protein ExoQ
MWFDQFFSVGLFSTIAMLAAIFLVMGLAMGLQIEPYVRRISSMVLPLVLLAGFAIGTLVSGRNAALYGLAGNLTEESSSSASIWVLRLFTLTAVGFATLVVASATLSKRGMPKGSRGLFLAFFAYYVCAYVVSGVLGTVPDISHKTLYPILIVTALYITSTYSAQAVLRVTRDGMLVFLVLGLLLIPVMPDLVAQHAYKGFVPGLSFRYWGLASHANNIGPLAVFFALVTTLHPYRWKAVNVVATLVVGLTLILAQSKTAVGAVFLVAGMLVLRIWFRAVFRNAFGLAGSSIGLAVATGIVATTLVFLVADLYQKPFDWLMTKIQGRTVLTGREYIWQITMAEWQNNPLFGYGPSLWGAEFSARHGYFGIATNAHNQVVDTLGAAGILGLAALVCYVTVLGYSAFRLADRTRWISVALFLFVLVRCVTEVPLKTVNVTTSDFFMHCVILAVFMRLLCERAGQITTGVPIASSVLSRGTT